MITIIYKLRGSEKEHEITISNMDSVSNDSDRMSAEGCAARRNAVSLYDVTFVRVKHENHRIVEG